MMVTQSSATWDVQWFPPLRVRMCRDVAFGDGAGRPADGQEIVVTGEGLEQQVQSFVASPQSAKAPDGAAQGKRTTVDASQASCRRA
jgi:hypothetical protein